MTASKALACAFLTLMLGFEGTAYAATLLSTASAANPRVVRLAYPNAPQDAGRLVVTVLTAAGGKHADVYLSDHDDTSFHQIGRIDDPAFATGACCGTLYELPQQVGSLRTGTLLWAASVGQNVTQDRRMAIRIYRSGDDGRSWHYLSEIKSPNQFGLWEPEFTIDHAGELVMFYSDETEHAQHSQAVSKVRSDDGLIWRDPGHVVASNVQPDRPGMPVTRRLADGRWMMTYELGGPAQFMVYYRLSDDGWTWGDPANVGSGIRLPNGSFPAHTPRFTVMPDGTLLLVSQMIETPKLKPGARSGQVLLINRTGNPTMPWQTIAAPVPVPDACSASCPSHQWCPNYSSALLPSADGTQVLELASDWNTGACFTSYAWGPWR